MRTFSKPARPSTQRRRPAAIGTAPKAHGAYSTRGSRGRSSPSCCSEIAANGTISIGLPLESAIRLRLPADLRSISRDLAAFLDHSGLELTEQMAEVDGLPVEA